MFMGTTFNLLLRPCIELKISTNIYLLLSDSKKLYTQSDQVLSGNLYLHWNRLFGSPELKAHKVSLIVW